jgi:hypothetical protein
MTRAQSAGLLGGDPSEMAEHFAGLLWGSLMTRLLFRVADRPTPPARSRVVPATPPHKNQPSLSL